MVHLPPYLCGRCALHVQNLFECCTSILERIATQANITRVKKVIRRLKLLLSNLLICDFTEETNNEVLPFADFFPFGNEKPSGRRENCEATKKPSRKSYRETLRLLRESARVLDATCSRN